MSLVDFLDPCPTCDGSGTLVNTVRCYCSPEPCPDCAGGLVVSEDDIEAVAEALYVADDGFEGLWNNIGDELRSTYREDARAAVTTLIQQWECKERKNG